MVWMIESLVDIPETSLRQDVDFENKLLDQ